MKSAAIGIALSALAMPCLAATAPSLEALAEYCYPANRAKTVTLQWLPDESAYAELSDDGRSINLFDPRKGESAGTLLSLDNTRETVLPADTRIADFILSPDGRKAIVQTDVKPVYRRSSTAVNYVYDTHSRILRPLSSACERQMIPTFSPDSRMVAFATPEGNLRIAKLDYGTEVAVTTDAVEHTLTYGVTDWAYEEEFVYTAALAWAPDCLTLCFLQFDQRPVEQYHMMLYDNLCDPSAERAARPGVFTNRYPLAGEPNSIVNLMSYNIETRQTRTIDLRAAVPDLEYVPAMSYGGTGEGAPLIVAALNRDQNCLSLISVNPRATTARVFFTDRAANGWIEPIAYTDLRCYPDFVVTASQRSGWTQLYEIAYSGAVSRAITPAGQDATAYYGYNAAKGVHWWQSTGGDPLCRAVGLTDSKGKTSFASKTDATSSAAFSPAMGWAVENYNSPTVAPQFTLLATSGNGWKAERTLCDNAELQARFSAMPRPRFFKVPATATAPELNGYVIESQGAKPAGGSPVIMYQYSGPGSQEVRRRWNVDWMNYYATLGYTVVCVDGRGTGGRGAEFLTSVYRRLGTLETEDQLRAAAYAATLPGVDPSRIGIFGWSFGGYEALMASTAPGNPFKATCAVAPVTDWRFYDSIYTERYMLTPGQNPDGYAASAPLERASQLSCPLLLMYGTADDNVHPCNPIDFAGRLIAEGRYCDMLLFPGMNHSINGCSTRAMVYWRMLNFFNANLLDASQH